ncbi:MAG: hypothetical protein D6718_12155 [Acidobacteria bacterium]|nr:MAG: hypothetical protein D6718_12155 [Acidobacteriota bacterium]
MSPRLRRFLAVLCGLVAAGCGHRARPRPPRPHIPETPAGVTWRLRGDRLEFAARVTPATLGGRPLRPPAELVLLALPVASPEKASGWNVPERAREYLRSAEEHPVGAAPGDGPAWVEGAIDLARLGDAPAFVVALAVRDRASRSLPSDRVPLVPAAPPPAPAACRLVPREEGVEIAWRLDEGEAGPDLVARVYRVDGPPGPEHWSAVAEGPIAAGSVIDRAVRYGERPAYEIVTGRPDGGVPQESFAVSCGAVAYEDRFPPAPPRDLDAVAQAGRIRIFWRAGGSPDEARVLIERQEEGEGRFEPLAAVPAPDFFYEDRAVEPGRRYRYRAAAEDAAGNRSAYAGPTDWLAPRPPAGTEP